MFSFRLCLLCTSLYQMVHAYGKKGRSNLATKPPSPSSAAIADREQAARFPYRHTQILESVVDIQLWHPCVAREGA